MRKDEIHSEESKNFLYLAIKIYKFESHDLFKFTMFSENCAPGPILYEGISTTASLSKSAIE